MTATVVGKHDRYAPHTCYEVTCAGCELGVYYYDQGSDDSHYETVDQTIRALRGGGWAVGADGLYCPKCLVGQNLEPLTYLSGLAAAEPVPNLHPDALPLVSCVSVHCEVCGRAFGGYYFEDEGFHYETEEDALVEAKLNDWIVIDGALHCPMCYGWLLPDDDRL